MSHKLFYVTQINPNDTTGGGGCVCSPQAQPDCKPPYVVFPGNDMENIASPHVVVCESCLVAGAKACTGEVLAAGEPSHTVPAEDVFDEDELPEV
jgi:hypothetical protein